jgi:hypothetical protein
MKQLKSSSLDLRELFSRDITVRSIAEPLASFDAEVAEATVKAFLSVHNYDVVGVRRSGFVRDYARAIDLDDGLGGALGDRAQAFPPQLLIQDSEPLVQAILALRETPYLFVESLGQVNGIVTRGDIQKAPVRMWLFGLISLTEMQLLRVIRANYPDDAWQIYLSEARLVVARERLAHRRANNAEIDLADCLQFCDKRDIVIKSPRLCSVIHPASKNKGEKLLRELEVLRNHLAHAQDIVSGQWPKTGDLAEAAAALLVRLENV